MNVYKIKPVIYIYHSLFPLGVRRNYSSLCHTFSRSGNGVEPFRLAIRSLGRSNSSTSRSYLHLILLFRIQNKYFIWAAVLITLLALELGVMN
jgi:hypothetical protein